MSHVFPLSTTSPLLLRTISLVDRLCPSPRAFTIRLWDGTELPPAHDPAFSLVLGHPGALRRMFTPPIEQSLGEAFIYGDFDIEGDIFSALSLIDPIFHRTSSLGEIASLMRDVMALPKTGPTRERDRGPARLRGVPHTRERDRAAVQYHYNAGNDFFALWLGRRMQYSCAYFHTGAEDIDTAQEQKLEHICRKLRLKPGERLLDIGCGWGGLAMYAAERHGVSVLGVTLSDKQAEYANEHIKHSGLADRVSVRLQDYRDLRPASFDKIVSVGMFEHVGRRHLPEYFSQAYQLLKPGGLFLNHGISCRSAVSYAANTPESAQKASGGKDFVGRWILGPGSFIQSYVFPDGELAPVSEVNLIAEQAGFEVRDVENLREHYARTLHHWVNRLVGQRAEAIRVTSEATYNTWRLYMAVSASSLEAGNHNINQTLLVKLDRGKSHLPLTRADLYA